jgi:hypothetical protein
MQGVPYPVLGIGSNGQQQIMQPGQDYNFGGASYVDEYPMMQLGGNTLLAPTLVMSKIAPSVVSMFSGNPLKKFIKWVNEPSENNTLNNRPSPLPVEKPVRTYGYDDTHSEYRDRANDVYSELKNNDAKEYNSPNKISLSSGRFRGAKVDPEMINDIVKAAKDNDVDPWVMLSLVGRESTFGSGTVKNVRRAGDKQDLVSGWNVAEDYMPYEFDRFLADKQVPGIKVHKNNNGWFYEVKDKKAVDDYLKKNPQLIDSYYKKIESTPDLGELDSFVLAAQRIKKKGIQNYNPGDPRYPSMVNEDMNLLKQDAELKAYMKSKGYKNGGIVKMQKGGTVYIDSVLNANKGLNWVQRLYEKNPQTIQIPGQKGTSTHFMESGDGRVYPSVVQMPNGQLQYLGDKAGDYADSTKTYIQFPNDKQAIRFGKMYKKGTGVLSGFKSGGQHGGLDRWFAEKWVDVKTGKDCGRQEGESRAGYPACRPSKRINSQTPKTSSEMSSAEKAKFKSSKTSSQRIDYNHKRNK